MAGIGFQLRKMLKRDSLSSDLSAYAYAGLVSAGPLILSILGILLIGLLSMKAADPAEPVVQFQVSVTYLIAFSLVITGLVQLLFTRFISDRLFQGQFERVLPNYNGVMMVTTLITGVVGVVLGATVFEGLSLAYRGLMLMGFVLVSNVWICTIFLASTKHYLTVFVAFLLGYGATVLAAVVLGRYGVEGFLASFVVGQVLLLGTLLVAIYRHHTSPDYIALQIFDRKHVYPSLVLIGFFFNLGVWVDKFIFWFAATGQDVIGPLRASVIYDLPIFISYLCIIPGMAVFFLRLESDFLEQYKGFYDAVRQGGTLSRIRAMRDRMVRSARTSLYEILKIQAVVSLLVFAFGDRLLEAIGISVLYLPLLRIDVLAASLQLLFLACLNIFLYLDRRETVLVLTATFAVLNAALTWITLEVGPNAYGFGFAGALLIVVLLAVAVLDRRFDRLEYETYMLQRN